MKEPKISVLIPVYNVEDYISKCIDSVLAQTLRDIEIILVNDGSKDSSAKIVAWYAQQDSRIRLINKQNGGLSSARNAGLELAQGKYIMVLDSDDYLEKNACERVYSETLENDADIVVFGAKVFPRTADVDWWLVNKLSVRTVYFEHDIPSVIFHENGAFPFTWRNCYKRTFLEEHHLVYDESVRFAEDTLFQFMAFPMAHSIAFIEDKLYNYRWTRKDSLMDIYNNQLYEKMQAHIEITDKILAYWEAHDMLEEHRIDFLLWMKEFLLDKLYEWHCEKAQFNQFEQLIIKYGLLNDDLVKSKAYKSLPKEIHRAYKPYIKKSADVQRHTTPVQKEEKGKKQNTGETAHVKQTIEAVSCESCTGCGACYNICPTQAIMMEYDEEGFLYPKINHEKCVRCGKCSSACPECNKYECANDDTAQRYFAVWTDNETRLKSSSGGVFTLLAHYVLAQKGVVFGARYSDDYSLVYHEMIDSDKQLDLLRKSKYVQSDVKLTYVEAKEKLNQGKWVLYTGTPCQIAGLYYYLGKDYERLLTADIICHGVPSPKAYNSYLTEHKGLKEIELVDFRDKSIVPWGTVEYIRFKDQTYYYNDCYRGFFLKSFLGGLCTRKSCGHCKYAKPQRQGDFTLGDFWGIKELLPNIPYERGVSLVSVNSPKARALFRKVTANANSHQVSNEEVLNLAKTKNGNLLHPTVNHYARKRFFELLKKNSFSEAVKKALYAKYDIGVVGWWYNLNYGGALTYFALHQVLEKMGFSVLMINKTSQDPNYHPDKKSVPYRFALKHYYISEVHSKYDMQGLNEHCKVFISGSDQLFNPILWTWSGPEYFLHFVNPPNKKISYASSFGNEFRHVNQLTYKIAFWLRQFDAISVREDYGVDIAKNEFGLKVTKVLDPVFLCDVEEYIKEAEKSKLKIKEPYYVNFILDPCEEKREIIFYVQSKLKKQYYNLVNADEIEKNNALLNLEHTKPNADVEDWLYLYYHSDFVITDSFHGTCFAIIFRKPFISIANVKRGEKRFISLLTELGLMEHLVYSLDEIKSKEKLFDKIDYTSVEEILRKKKEESWNWLYDAITSPPREYSKNDFLILSEKINELEQEIAKLKILK